MPRLQIPKMVSESILDEVVAFWRRYAEESPRRINPMDLLIKRDLIMYRGLGLKTHKELARRLVEDRALASLEMTMGHLYERLLEALGPSKLSNAQKQQPGNRGIDFIEHRPFELRLINLKAGQTTSNADIADATVRHLLRAKSHYSPVTLQKDDNPLQRKAKSIVLIRALAKGPRGRRVTGDGILVLVGDEMWAYFGAGEGLLQRLQEAMGRNPLDYERYKQALQDVQDSLTRLMEDKRLVATDGTVDWWRLLALNTQSAA